MRSLLARIGVVAVFTLLPGVALAADIDAGKALAKASCQACHGMNGIGIIDQYPDLAGQKAAYLEAQIKAFRDGSRTNPIMGPMAKPLSDADAANVAAYYSSLARH